MAELEFEQRESDMSGCALARCIRSLRRHRAIEKIKNRFSQVVCVCGGKRRPPCPLAHLVKIASVPTSCAHSPGRTGEEGREQVPRVGVCKL